MYAAKHVGKSFDGTKLGKNRRRFLAARGAVVPVVRALADSLDEVAAAVEAVGGGYVVRAEAEDGRPPIVWASWD